MKNIITTLLTTTLVLITSVVFSQGACENATTYTYDGYTYDLIEIGDQCWFSEPIKTTVYQNGDNITAIQGDDTDDWKNNTTGAYTITVDDDYLYNWYAVSQGVCPSGYSVPTDADFIKLEKELGVKRSERKSFNYRGTGIDFRANWFDAGFDISFAGIRVDSDGKLKEFQEGMYMWTLDEVENENAIDRAIFSYMNFVARHNNLWQTSDNKGHGMLAMCVKDDTEDVANIDAVFSPMYIMPGPTSIELEDFLENFNAGDTVYLNEQFTQVPEIGTTYVNPNGKVLEVGQDGVLIDSAVGADGPIRTQTCGCISYTPGGGCSIQWMTGGQRLSCANICASNNLSWSPNLVDWVNCSGNEVAPTETEDFKGYTFRSPRGVDYTVDRFTTKLYFDDVSRVNKVSDFTNIRAYVDKDRTIPYSHEKIYSTTKRQDLVNPPNDQYVIWNDERTGTSHAFRIDATTGYLVEDLTDVVDILDRGQYPYYIACQCVNCCPEGGMDAVNVQGIVQINSGDVNCTNGCSGEITVGEETYHGLSVDGGAPGGCCPVGIWNPIDEDIDEAEIFRVVHGDTTISRLDEYYTLNILDTIYIDSNLTVVPKVGTSFINKYDQILYTDAEGVLRYGDFFDSNLLKEYYGDPYQQASLQCCDPTTGVNATVIVTSHFRRGCNYHCKKNGLVCAGNCQNGFGTEYLLESGNASLRAAYLRNLSFEVDEYLSPNVDFENAVNYDGVYLNGVYTGFIEEFNRDLNIASQLDEDHFAYVNGTVTEIDGLVYRINENLMLELSTKNNGLDPQDDWILTEIGGDPLGNACWCCCGRGPTSRKQLILVYGPSRKTCGRICANNNCIWTDLCGDNASIAQDIATTYRVAYGDSSRYYGDIGYTFNVFDTVYTDYNKLRPLPFGSSIRNAYNQVLYADEAGVLKSADMFDIDIENAFAADPTLTQTCVCCSNGNIVTVNSTNIKKGCTEICTNQGYEPYALIDGCNKSGTNPLDEISRKRYNQLTTAELVSFNTLVNGTESSVADVSFTLREDDVSRLVGQTLTFGFDEKILGGSTQKGVENFEFMKGMVFKISGYPNWFRINESFVVEGGGLDPLPQWGGDPQYINMCICWSDAPDCTMHYKWSTRIRRSCTKICSPDNSFNPCND
jgi:uncharacterized protein (TIGR02145 family)